MPRALRLVHEGGVSAIKALGLDPGKRTGWGVIELAGALETVVAFGELDPLDPVADLRRLLAEHQPGRVGIEIVKRVHPVRRGEHVGISTDQAQSLYDAGLLAGELKGEAARAGVRVDPFSAEAWRGALILKEQPSNAEIEDKLRARLSASFPARRKSNDHERDAIGIALWAALRARIGALEIRR